MDGVRRFGKVLLVICVLATSCGKASPSPSPTPPFPVECVEIRGNKPPDRVARELELAPQKTFKDYMDLGIAYVCLGKYIEASEAYEMAARQAQSTDDLVKALYGKTAVLAYVNLPEALRIADFLVKLRPDSIELAKVRYGLYLHSGDQMGTLVAGEHLIALDPSLRGREILSPAAAVVIGIVSVVAVVTAGEVIIYALTPPEDRAQIAPYIAAGMAEVGKASLNLTPTFGRMLLSP